MHIFDLTKKVKLEGKLQTKYVIARIMLHVVFLATMLFVAYRILFPIVPFDFSMKTPLSAKNTLVSPHLAQTGEFPTKRIVKASDTIIFDANPIGQFSEANFSFIPDKNTGTLENTTIEISKSYQAFFYPAGEQIGLRDGTLASTSTGSYYIVSNGTLRKFANTDIILKLGYPKSAFIEISTDDMKLNKIGTDIANADSYPDNTFFAINDTYYQLKNQQLFAFISVRAFLSQFDANLAIAKTSDFLSKYPLSETNLGFADGTLASSADSVFILSDGKSYPIENEVTFSAMGFAWDAVVSVTTNELSAYVKQKQFTNRDPHPNGTIFIDQKTNEWFAIENGKKCEIKNETVKKSYSKQRPILVNALDAKKQAACTLKKNSLGFNEYSCGVSLESLDPLVGNDYQISATFQKESTLSTINTTFSTPLTTDSLKSSLSVIKTKLKNR